MVLGPDVMGLLQLQRAQAGFQGFLVEPMVAGLSLLALDHDSGFFQRPRVMAKQGQRDVDGIGNVLAGSLLAIGQEFYDLQSGRVAQGFENFGALIQVELAHRAMLLAFGVIGKLNA